MQLWNWAMVTASTCIWEIELEDAGVRIFGIIPVTHMMRKHFNVRRAALLREAAN